MTSSVKGAEDSELLFFDTFSHDSCEVLNLDLVQFPYPVYIFEIRVIPLGARVQADFPGGHRLGATNPSSFRLEFFANDLSKRSVCAFQPLGSLDYKQNAEIQFTVGSKIPTDGLVLRGLYSAVTLAIYGILTKPSSKERAASAPPPPPVSCSQTQAERPNSDASGNDWDRHQRPIEAVTDSAASATHSHSQPLIDGPRYSEVPPIIHPKTEPHVQYSAEIPQPVYPDQPPANVGYPECIPASVPPPVPYNAYDARYQKPWPSSEDHFHNQNENFDPQVYNRPPDASSYLPPASVPHPTWEPKECHATDMAKQEHDSYDQNIHEHKPHTRSKDRRDKPWDRDGSSSEYSKDDERDRDYKRKDQDTRSWERNSESDRYRDKDKSKESSSRERERVREKTRSHDSYSDRNTRPVVKRPVTPPTPPSSSHRMPQTPPEPDKPSGGPRTPKEESPSETLEDREQSAGTHATDYHGTPSSERGRSAELLYNLSEGEVQEGENTDDDGYEEIVSEEEIMSDGEDRVLDMVEIDYDLGDESWNYISFNPYHCELTSNVFLEDPTATLMESLSKKKKQDASSEQSEEASDEENKLSQMIHQFDEKEHTEKWIEAIESLTSQIIAESILESKSEKSRNDIISALINWVLEALNFDAALCQPQTAYKVRHIKAGIHLATLMFRTSNEIVQKLLDHEVPKLLLQLMEAPYMTLPIKLMIIRALDAVTNCKLGLLFFISRDVDFSPPKSFDMIQSYNAQEICGQIKQFRTCYQNLLRILMSKQLTRAVVAMTGLVQKIHLFEVLQGLQDCIESLVQGSQAELHKSCVGTEEAADNTTSASTEILTQPVAEMEVDPTETGVGSTSWEDNVQIIIATLNKITYMYHNAGKTVGQFKRFLPASKQFESPKCLYDPHPGLLRMFKECNLVEYLLSFLSSSSSLLHYSGVILAVRDLMMEILHSLDGMLFLLSSSETINGIQKVLLQNLDESRDDSEENIAHGLGLQIVFRLQAMLYIDALFFHHSKQKEVDDPEAVSVLQHMYTMIFSPTGRAAVVEVLATGDNLKSLLPFVQMTKDEEMNTRKSKSVCAGYVTEFLMLILQTSENVPMLEKFSETLYNISQQELTPKLHDLGSWVSPVRNLTAYNYDAVPGLAAVLKCHLEDAATLPPELITAVRALKYICLPPTDDNKELKYMYSLIQFFSHDGLTYFITILQNICDVYLKPSHQSVTLVGQQGVLLMGLVKPSISLLKAMLCYLIASRKDEFKDLTAIPVLLQTFSLVLMVPPSSFAYATIHVAQEEIIEALLAYTQPCLGTDESDEALGKSLWTQMIQEVLKYIQQSPRTFIAGLSVLSELLPLPLPLQTREPLKSEEISRTVNQRKLWSAHLHCVSDKLQIVIRSLSTSSSHPLQQLLRRICIQLADLAAPSALVVVRAVLDGLLETFEAETKDAMDNPILTISSGTTSAPAASTAVPSAPIIHPPGTVPCSLSTARALNLISYLVSHASFKVPLMHILKTNTKADEKYGDLLSVLLNLLNIDCDRPSHIQSQECIVSILQALCDPDIGFIAFSETNVNEVLASCLPVKEQMIQICVSLIQHVGCHNHQYTSVLPSLRSLMMLNEHDYGFYYVKLALEQNPDSISSLFCRLSGSFNKDSSDYLSMLSTTLDLLRLMVNGYEEGPQGVRTMLLAPSELASILKNKSVKEENKKSDFLPLEELNKLLSEAASEEYAVESLLEGVSSLLLLLHESDGKEKPEQKELAEPVLPSPDSLANQFAVRPVFVVGEVEEERLSPAYWLSVPSADEADQEQEQVSVDLMAMSEKYISEFDLKSHLESLCMPSDAETTIKKDKNLSYGTKRKYQTLMNPMSDGGIKKPFIAPMRGRSFGRGNTHTTRANDPFRSRPPNTSRPPSMHVDDFLALESNHPTGALQSTLKRQDGSRGRGRGFDRNQAFPSLRGGSGTGGRFFNPAGPYGRRDPNSRGGSRGTLRVSSSAWGNRTATTVLKSPSSIGVRTSFSPRTSVTERCSYSDLFVPQEIRLTTQRSRDPYADVDLPPDMRFSRGIRTTSTIVPTLQSHWPDSRNKSQNQRFMSNVSPARGSGRRDLNGRHSRSFTR